MSVGEEQVTPAAREFFETKIRPVLVAHCYECHGSKGETRQAELRLDLRAGWMKGGTSGKPTIVPGRPEDSPLLAAIAHRDGVEPMPPDKPKLSDEIIANLTRWIAEGAADPRTEDIDPNSATKEWEELYRQRLDWWSLQPLLAPAPPKEPSGAWPRNDVDRYILAKLVEKNLHPTAEASPLQLFRRLHVTLTGLPPKPEDLARFRVDASPDAFDAEVERLLKSPHFGEHWARHWLDVVHYSDTHGYEWDVPAKNAWMYRDYVTRVFNEDMPIKQFFLEQLAGDLLPPRLDVTSGRNQSLVATMALRLGERRHGDSAAAEGVTQEAMANIIDTVSKGFLATTVACAQCHDHKLDAVAQADFFALAGMFMSTRWGASPVDLRDPNEEIIAELKEIKRDARDELVSLWLAAIPELPTKLANLPKGEPPTLEAFPETLLAHWQRAQEKPLTSEEFTAERARRQAENQANLTLLADFAQEDNTSGWRAEGFGMKHGQARSGNFVLAEEGEEVVREILPAGRFSHLYSARLAGAIRSPLFPREAFVTFSLGLLGRSHSSWTFIVDQAFHSERMQMLNQPLRYITLAAGHFDTLEGSIDAMPRRVYFEATTKTLNNYYPPRVNYGGVKEAELADPRSVLGVTRVYAHPQGKPPLDAQDRFVLLFKSAGDPVTRFTHLLKESMERWAEDKASDADAILLDEALHLGLLPNRQTPRIAEVLSRYRAAEKRLVTDQTMGTMTDWSEGSDERVWIRGNYTDLGSAIERGNIRFLGGPAKRADSRASGRLEFAQAIVDEKNPLTARVYVNRVWHHLFGEGLVRTPDDFGHLGETPSHPELLDYLAWRFMDEGWSTKKLVRLLVTSSTWRQGNRLDDEALRVDPENRLWHHRPARRMEAESLRDAILVVAGKLDPLLGGPPIDPYRTAEDASKRLFAGPLDGQGRRSLYIKMTLMEPPRFLALFNQPIPKLTTGKRDITNVPTQALALLNDPFVRAMATAWSETLLTDRALTPEARAERMIERAFARPAKAQEAERLSQLARTSAKLRGHDESIVMNDKEAWQDVAHALFNTKEFLYVP
ncbi:PSD1 and planctomycete cytochrome C domain-containing protein [bacterium]|nr:PSD1 and planctomycete cytochrome C domain-containing protein [bacterium]